MYSINKENSKAKGNMQADYTLRSSIQLDMNSYVEGKHSLRNSSHNSTRAPSNIEQCDNKYTTLGGETRLSKNSPNNDSASTKEGSSSN